MKDRRGEGLGGAVPVGHTHMLMLITILLGMIHVLIDIHYSVGYGGLGAVGDIAL